MPWITSDRVMAAFTVVIAVVAVFQWCVFSGQLDEMRIDQRAWLSVKPNLLAAQVNGMVLAPTTVTNVGKTAAKNIQGWVFIQTVPRNNTIDFSNPTFTEAPRATPGQPLPVSMKFNVGVLIPGEPLTFNEVAIRQQASTKSPVVPVAWTQTMQEQYDKGDFYLAVRASFHLRRCRWKPALDQGLQNWRSVRTS